MGVLDTHVDGVRPIIEIEVGKLGVNDLSELQRYAVNEAIKRFLQDGLGGGSVHSDGSNLAGCALRK